MTAESHAAPETSPKAGASGPFARVSDCPPVTGEDRALVRSVVGDPEARFDVRRQKCPACEGRGRVTLDKVTLKSAKCTRCNGGEQNDGRVSSLTLDEMTRKHTGFASFIELCFDVGGVKSYRPSICVDRSPEKKRLADNYDAVQEARGDARRVYRG